jgi:hypothetical protein
MNDIPPWKLKRVAIISLVLFVLTLALLVWLNW